MVEVQSGIVVYSISEYGDGSICSDDRELSEVLYIAAKCLQVGDRRVVVYLQFEWRRAARVNPA
jgi:type IV secretory pathway TraG/TraD family ATPase VirD4